MELIVITIGALSLIGALVLWALLGIANRMPDNRPRRATARERERNQAEIREWVARSGGSNHATHTRDRV